MTTLTVKQNQLNSIQLNVFISKILYKHDI